VLGAAHALGQLPIRPRPDGELAAVERHKQRVKAQGGQPAAALAGRLDRALADGLGIEGRHAEAVAGEGLAQRRSSSAQLLSRGIDATELLAAGLPAHPPAGIRLSTDQAG